MSILEALILGIVQGLTEFLPISSTAHLRVVPELFGWQDPGAAFTAVIQLGTLVAVLIYFQSDIIRLLRAWLVDVRSFRYGTSQDAKLAWMIAVGTIPVVICGLAFKKYIKEDLRDLHVIAWAAIGFSMLLLIAELRAFRQRAVGLTGREESSISWFDALLVGCFQAMALVPGASRSGVTITAGLLAGLSRSTAARFSFLLSLPSVFAAGVYQFYEERQRILASQNDLIAIIIASVVSGIIGYASIAFLLRFLKTHTTYVFIIYRVVLGVTMLVLLRQGILKG